MTMQNVLTWQFLEEKPRAQRSGTCKHQFSHTSAIANWTSLLNFFKLFQREAINWIVLWVKGTKPVVKLVARVLLASK